MTSAEREAFVTVLAHLVGAVSLLEHPVPRKAVASDRMFKTMLADYRRAIEAGRAALRAADTTPDGYRPGYHCHRCTTPAECSKSGCDFAPDSVY